MKITTLGIDLAKNVFQVHGIDEHGKAVLKPDITGCNMGIFMTCRGAILALMRLNGGS